MPSFSDWARYMSSHAIYACAWPIALPIEMVCGGQTVRRAEDSCADAAADLRRRARRSG
jgi:hypothetical protein